MNGTEDPDTLTFVYLDEEVRNADRVAYGLEEADEIFGSDESTSDVQNDELHGGTGGDTISLDAGSAGTHKDEAYGDGGIDTIDGDAGADIIYGGGEDDTLSGNGGDDTIHGQNGGDTIFGGSGADTITGGDGDDIIEGNAGDDTIEGNDGGDILRGGGDNDTLYGGGGGDILCGGATSGAGSDYLHAVSSGFTELPNAVDFLWSPDTANTPSGAGAQLGDECGDQDHGSTWAGVSCDYTNQDAQRPTECDS